MYLSKTISCVKLLNTLLMSFSDQRLAESMRPYLDDLQGVWLELLLAGLCGGVVTVIVAAGVLLAKRRSKGMLWHSGKSWRTTFALPETQPLIWRNETEESNPRSYQTTMWKQMLCRMYAGNSVRLSKFKYV